MSTILAEMMKKEEKRKAIPGNSYEIDLIEEAGILVTVKTKPNPKLATAASGGESSVGLEDPNKEKHMLKPCSSRSRIVRLTNAVIVEYDFESEEDYENLYLDLRDSAERFGKLVDVVVPRPSPDPCLTPPGVGKAFLEFEDLDGASRARSAFNGNQWGMNIVGADYFPENLYALGDLDA